MKLHLIFVGKTREAYLRQGVEDFLARLRRYVPVDVAVVRAEPLSGKIQMLIQGVSAAAGTLFPVVGACNLDQVGPGVASPAFWGVWPPVCTLGALRLVHG